jgi:hypothetical protein
MNLSNNVGKSAFNYKLIKILFSNIYYTIKNSSCGCCNVRCLSQNYNNIESFSLDKANNMNKLIKSNSTNSEIYHSEEQQSYTSCLLNKALNIHIT